MTRSQPRYGVDGPTEGAGPLSGSGNPRAPEHHEQRRDLWGDVRDLEDDPDEPDEQNYRPPISPEKAADIYVTVHTTDMLYDEVAEMYDVSDNTVGKVARRDGRFGRMDEIAEVALELKEKGVL